MLGRVFFNLLSHFTIKHFTSSHVILLLIMGEISLEWGEKSTLDIVSYSIIFIIEFLMLLIFCEIIELNFWGLSDNTRKNIKKRAGEVDFEEFESNESMEIDDGMELTS